MKIVLAASLVAFAAADIAPEVVSAFKDFTTKYEKQYQDDVEWARRLDVFAENIERVAQLNRQHLLLSGSVVHGVTKFMDLTPDEFSSQYLNYVPLNTTGIPRVSLAGAARYHQTGSASCAANSKCAALGLKGDCCPTSSGVTLDCCDSPGPSPTPAAPTPAAVPTPAAPTPATPTPAPPTPAPKPTGDVDWRTKDAVTAVKDQGQCGSCWAFSATEAIESYAFLDGGYKLQELSPQQITSCDIIDSGCDGGSTEYAYLYVRNTGGIATEKDDPYVSGGGSPGQCHEIFTQKAVSIHGYNTVVAGEDNLQDALAHGPVSVCVAATSFQFYEGGILSACEGRMNHCVQAVGYSTSGNYWIVRNSWAANWGEEGYIRVKMGEDLCYIADDVTYPTFKK